MQERDEERPSIESYEKEKEKKLFLVSSGVKSESEIC